MEGTIPTPVSITEAKATFSALIRRVEAGERIALTKRGKVIAELLPGQGRRTTDLQTPLTPRKPIDLEALRALTDNMTPQTQSAGEFVRWMRDTDRY